MTTRRAAYWALGVIFLANFFNYLDRQLVSALETPLRKSLELEQWEYGLLWTLFTVGYMVCAVPIGLLADRVSRTRLFAACIIVWSVATIASGLATGKVVLYVARIFIGVGEAGCLVVGPSLISDLFARRYRARALSIFFLAMPLGGTSAFLMAGALFGFGWRNMFYLAGAPGFLIAVLIWLLADPPRGASEGAQHGMPAGGMSEYLKLLRTPTLLLIILAQAFAVIILIPLIHFGIGFFEETRHMNPKDARLALGVMSLVGGVMGIGVSGILGDQLFKRTKRAYSLLAAVSYLAAFPCLYIGFYSDQQAVYFTALTAGSFFLFLCMPAVNTQIANVVSPAQRATAWALAVFILHMLGDTLAPPVFGLVSDAVGRQAAFGYFSFCMLLAGGCCIAATFTAKRDTERVARLIEAQAQEPSANGDDELSAGHPAASNALPTAPAADRPAVP
jgi:predicted MFS family arabinose efflux permease